MKSFLLSLILLLGMTFYCPLMAQPPQDSVYLYLETESNNDTVDLYLRVINFTNVGSIQFSIGFDEKIFEYQLINSNKLVTISNANFAISKNKIRYSWIEPSLGTIALEDNDYLLKIRFLNIGTSSNYCINFLNENLIPTEIANANGEILNARTIGSCGTLNFTNIYGKVFADLNNNCQNEINEKGLNGVIINFESGGKNYTTITNKNGEFIKNVEPGIYEMSISHPSLLWKNCTFNSTIDASDKTKSIKLTNYLNPLVSCPSLEVELSNSRLRICAENNLAINYFNYGTSVANNSYVELKLDPRIQLVDASIPFVNLGNDQYKLDIGTINAVEGGIVNATIKTTCDVEELNKSICMEARIFPNEYCGPTLPLWSGADLKIDSRCVNDKVEFTIKNIGKGDMAQELSYTIVEDDLMPNGLSRLKLNQNESKIIEVPSNGKTIRIITDTIPHHPYKVRYSSAIEACGINNTSKGFISKFSFGDEDPHLDILCNTLRGSYDPNDKAGTPLGAGLENNIQKTDRIQYLIRFQNTGSDTAFRVEVIDTISEQMDLGTLKVIGASHPLIWSNKEDRTLKFLFNKIKLVDSTTNEKESNGYVLYSIKPKENIPYKTQIFNHADIYFDFNPPIRTNTTLHTISEPITIVQDSKSDYKVNLYPNPTMDKFTVEIKDLSMDLELELVDIFGRKIIDQTLNKSVNVVNFPSKMLSGTYYYNIKKNKQIVSAGNIIKHK